MGQNMSLYFGCKLLLYAPILFDKLLNIVYLGINMLEKFVYFLSHLLLAVDVIFTKVFLLFFYGYYCFKTGK